VSVVLARVGVGVGEFDIGEQAIGARFMDPAGVENRAVRFVLIESQV
jgi:hypothetical protein